MNNKKACFLSLDTILNNYACEEMHSKEGAINALGVLRGLGFDIHIITNKQNIRSKIQIVNKDEEIKGIISHFTFTNEEKSVIKSIDYSYLDRNNPEYITSQGKIILNIINEFNYNKDDCWLITFEEFDVIAGIAIGLYKYFCKDLLEEKKNLYDFVFDYRNENWKLMNELRELNYDIIRNFRMFYKTKRYKEIIRILNERKIKIPFETCLIYSE